jgi:vacuolar-type H+-ATPase subunit I/STV1
VSNVVDIGRAKASLRKNKTLTGRQRNLILARGTPDEIKKLYQIEEKYKPHKEIVMFVTVKEINHPAFIGALSKLDNCSKFPTAAAAWGVMKLVKSCHELIQDQRTLYTKLVKEYAQVDDKGDVMLTDHKEIIYKDDEAKKEHEAKFKEFMDAKLEVTGTPLKIETLDNVGLAPIELDALECLIDKANI